MSSSMSPANMLSAMRWSAITPAICLARATAGNRRACSIGSCARVLRERVEGPPHASCLGTLEDNFQSVPRFIGSFNLLNGGGQAGGYKGKNSNWIARGTEG